VDTAAPDVRVYRSYELTGADDGRLTAGVTAESVPDIKIYRRSAVLYTGDDDDYYDNDQYLIHPRYSHRQRSVSPNEWSKRFDERPHRTAPHLSPPPPRRRRRRVHYKTALSL